MRQIARRHAVARQGIAKHHGQQRIGGLLWRQVRADHTQAHQIGLDYIAIMTTMFNNVRRISRQLFAYGTADVMVLAVNFLLLPIYTRVLSPREYGALALLLVCEAVLKVINRWGLDGSFLRFYYDHPDEDAEDAGRNHCRVSAVTNGAIASCWWSSRRSTAAVDSLDSRSLSAARRQRFRFDLLLLPMNLLRIQERCACSPLTFLRSFGTRLGLFLSSASVSHSGRRSRTSLSPCVVAAVLRRTFRRMLAWHFLPACFSRPGFFSAGAIRR